MSDQLRVAQQIHSEDWEEAVSPDSRLPYSARSVLESSKPGICCSKRGKRQEFVRCLSPTATATVQSLDM